MSEESGRKEGGGLKAVNGLLWCVLKPHEIAWNHCRDMLRRVGAWSVWFTLKLSLIPVWWLPWVYTVSNLTPNRFNTIKFLGAIGVSMCQLPNHGQRKGLKNYLWELGRLKPTYWVNHRYQSPFFWARQGFFFKKERLMNGEGTDPRKQKKKYEVWGCLSKFKRWM